MIAASDDQSFNQSFNTSPLNLMRYLKHPPANIKIHRQRSN